MVRGNMATDNLEDFVLLFLSSWWVPQPGVDSLENIVLDVSRSFSPCPPRAHSRLSSRCLRGDFSIARSLPLSLSPYPSPPPSFISFLESRSNFLYYIAITSTSGFGFC